MEIQTVPGIKINNPAPTVEQINADEITQVRVCKTMSVSVENNSQLS